MRQIGNIKIGEFVRDENGTTWQVNCHYRSGWKKEKMTTLREVNEGNTHRLAFKPSETKMEYLGDICFVKGQAFVPTKRNPFE